MSYLVLQEITKSFGTFRANDEVSLHVEGGTVHAILGENGAGKSTLMNVLYGLYQPDSGSIRIAGRRVTVGSPRAALALGIGMIHQHFTLVSSMSVLENVILGLDQGTPFLRQKRHRNRLVELAHSFGFEIDPEQRTDELPIGRQQQVEILKLLFRDARILILDEPTSVLSPREISTLVDILGDLKAAGKTILLITHKLEEVMAIADRVTVLRHGRVCAEVAVAETDTRELARLMVGRDVVFDIHRSRAAPGEAILKVEDLRARDDRGLEAVDGVSFTLHRGEILGFAGVDGNGQREVAEALVGMRPHTGGRILVDGKAIDALPVKERKHSVGIGYVPDDRRGVGLVLEETATFNIMLRNYDRPPLCRRTWLDARRIAEHAERLVATYDVRLRSVDQLVRYLSGGNQQKLLLAREFFDEPRILVVVNPCRGLDVGAIEFVQKSLLRQKEKGVAVLYFSTELEHLLSISDRLAVLFRGRITGMLQPEEATSERLGLLMAGIAEAS